MGAFLDRLSDLFALLRGTTGGCECQYVAHDLGRIRGVVHQGLGANGDLVAEDGGDLMRVARATDVAQQRDPVGGVAQLRVEAPLITQPHGQEARPQLRLERLAERVVLRKSKRGDELTHPQRFRRNRETSRCAKA